VWDPIWNEIFEEHKQSKCIQKLLRVTQNIYDIEKKVVLKNVREFETVEHEWAYNG